MKFGREGACDVEMQILSMKTKRLLSLWG